MPKAKPASTGRTWMTADELPTDARPRLEHAGKLVAWSSRDLDRIVAAGDDYAEVSEAARRAGFEHPIYEWLPPVSMRPIDDGA